ncbi:PH domain-containing protein [Streptomyces triticirhizae]|uniref:PH domain-containing protein n=1 Tax=Streptomyces triticirhizae TaxID=2483353 RepID=UPI00131573A6|nr:PH domain-containing protein [Streptomyces triticirhizae]
MLRHRPRCAAWALATLAAITCAALSVWASTRDRGPFAPETSVDPAEYALWALLTAGCARAAARRLVLRPEGVVLVGMVRNRRVRWADVVAVELALRTGSTQPGGRWRIALRLADGTARWVPTFVHGAMGLHQGPEFGPGDRGRYGQVFHHAPPHAPRELARLHAALSVAWRATRRH